MIFKVFRQCSIRDVRRQFKRYNDTIDRLQLNTAAFDNRSCESIRRIVDHLIRMIIDTRRSVLKGNVTKRFKLSAGSQLVSGLVWSASWNVGEMNRRDETN